MAGEGCGMRRGVCGCFGGQVEVPFGGEAVATDWGVILSGMAGVFAFARSAGTWSRRISLGSDSEVRENRREILRLRLRARENRGKGKGARNSAPFLRQGKRDDDVKDDGEERFFDCVPAVRAKTKTGDAPLPSFVRASRMAARGSCSAGFQPANLPFRPTP